MIDHVNLPVADLARARAFYIRALKPLGLKMLMRDGDAIGFGNGTWTFGIVLAPQPVWPLHIAFAAASRALVDNFFAEALAAGAQPHGRPGLRPHYDATYYAAYVRDPDGHNVEAVCRTAV